MADWQFIPIGGFPGAFAVASASRWQSLGPFPVRELPWGRMQPPWSPPPQAFSEGDFPDRGELTYPGDGTFVHAGAVGAPAVGSIGWEGQ